MTELQQKTVFIPTGTGWELEIRRSWNPATLNPQRRPLLMLPGLGNNAAVFLYPDNRRSWEAFMVREGVEVWTANLRGQGRSRFLGRRQPPILMEDLALVDLPTVLDYMVHNTLTGQNRVDVIGASLGAAIMYAYAVLHKGARLGAMVSVGGPFRWEQCHPLVALVMSRPRLVGMVPVRGSRLFLRHSFPLLRRFPIFLKHYIQPDAIAGTHPEGLLPSVDDPNRHLARQIAEWINNKDLLVQGVNITTGLRHVSNPLLCATGNVDGIVPLPTSLAALAASGASPSHKQALMIGDDATPFGHTDPMIHRESPTRVFQPIAAWLDEQHQRFPTL